MDRIPLAFTESDLSYIITVLSERPYREVATIMAEIAKQTARAASAPAAVGPLEADGRG